MIPKSIELSRGAPLPFGVSVVRGGINFAIFSRHATAVTLLLFERDQPVPFRELEFHPRLNRTGDVWHAFVDELDPGVHYAYRMDRVPNEDPLIYRFDEESILLDPYARAVVGRPIWGHHATEQLQSRRCAVVESHFDWGDDLPLNIPMADSIIYEMHVRGFTQDRSSGVLKRGSYAGVIEKIPYLQMLGVTAVELLPIYEFEETGNKRFNPITGERLVDFWGYNPISFFTPKAAYSSTGGDDGAIREFKTLVKSLHEAGIEVILDVVFNHTSEGNEQGPTHSFRGLDNPTYYMLNRQTGAYLNYSGCGNTLNCNHPVVRDLVSEALRYWVTEMHVDGFRFDLASILGRGQDGGVLSSPPLLEQLAYDPVLGNTKLIAEAWDAAGLYQVGTFPSWGRWAEWNGKYRDDIRKFLRGDPGMVSALATRLVGSPDLYSENAREPWHSVNFVTCHDGFTLADLVSYNGKHNLANGENETDGSNENISWNHGVEGSTSDPQIQRLRDRQVRNFAVLLMLSQGVPMMLAGDEAGRTQGGNNNPFCQDNETSWFNWNLIDENRDLVRFFRLLIRFRRDHSILRRGTFSIPADVGSPRVEWHGSKLHQPDFGENSHSLAMHLHGCPATGQQHIYLIANAYWEAEMFELPIVSGWKWIRCIDTMYGSPLDICEPDEERSLEGAGQYEAGPRSVVVFQGRRRTA